MGGLQAHSSRRPLHQPAPNHPDIGERKQRDELGRVLGQYPVTHFDVTELTLDDPKRMLHIDPHAGFELFGLFVQCAPRRVPLRAALARAHRHMPIHASGVSPLAGALLTCIGKDNLLFPVQQRVALRNIVEVNSRADDRVYQAEIGVHHYMWLHTKVPLVAALDLVHRWSRSPLLFLVEIGTAIKAASNPVPVLSNKPWRPPWRW